MASPRIRDDVVAIKLETVAGVYEAPSVPDDVLPISSASFNPDVEQIPDGRRVGGLDSGPITVGRVASVGQLETEIIGNLNSSAPACPATLKRLLQIGGWLFTTQATPIPASGVADVTAGGVNTCTVDRSVFTTFPATTGALVACDVELSGVPAVTERRTIATYVVTGNNVVMTFTKAPSVTLTTSTKAKVLPHERAVLHSGDHPTASIDRYLGGRKVSYRHVCADLSLNLSSGGRAMIAASLRGKFQGSPSNVTQPTPSPIATLAPVWRGGIMRVGGQLARVNTLTHALGNQQGRYGDPEDPAGFFGYENMSRDVRLTIDPKEQPLSEVDWQTLLLAGTETLVHAQVGAAAGNRFSLVVGRAKPISLADKDVEGFVGHDVGFKAEGRDAEVSASAWT